MMNDEHFFRICHLLHLDIQSLKRDYEIESKIIANKSNWDKKIIVFKHITIFNEKQQISKKAMKNQINQLLT